MRGTGLVLATCLCATAAPATADPATGRPVAVVELFTSQSCANCPPADAFLAEMAADRELVTLSFPVDYWDWLGWKDTAAKPEFTRRQKSYAAARGDREVFTPQMVVNGRKQVVGSDRAAIRREISAGTAAAHRDLAVEVDLEATGDALVVRIADAPADWDGAQATVWLARYDHRRTVPVGRGENNGRTLTYAHLVRSLQPIGMWKGRSVRIELPREGTAADRDVGCAVLVQVEQGGLPGAIVGAQTCGGPAS
ncbi:MAG: DUF1223 domain-containing protein [Siculibacillus sp.]